jgi:hypothetical protein
MEILYGRSSTIHVKLSDRIRNDVLTEKCNVKEDVVTKIKNNMLIWFGHVKRMDERRLRKDYDTGLDRNAVRGSPRR